MNLRFSLLACLLLSLFCASAARADHGMASPWILLSSFSMASNGESNAIQLANQKCAEIAANPGITVNVKIDSSYQSHYSAACWYTYAQVCATGSQWDGSIQQCAVVRASPEECKVAGQLYDDGSCVDSCPNGALNGQCLNGSEPEATEGDTGNDPDGDGVPNYGDDPSGCDAGDSNYVGMIDRKPYCMTCPTGDTAGFVNGAPICLKGDPTVNPENPEDNCSPPKIPILVGGQMTCGTPDGADTLDPNGNPINETGDQAEYADGGKSDGTTTTNPDGSTSTSTNTPSLSKIEKNTREQLEASDKTNQLLDDIAGSNREIADLLAGEEPTDEEPETPISYDDSAPTIAESSTAFMNRINNAPIVAAFATAPTVTENNSCPVFGGNVPILGQLTFDIHCDVFSQHGGTLSAIFIAMWTLLAGLVFLRS